jgi:hypothetical protein
MSQGRPCTPTSFVFAAIPCGAHSTFRVTDVWDFAERWQIVHHPAEQL